jgi:hypothetical protein
MSKPEGRRSVGRPKMRWLDDVEEDLWKMKIGGWRGKTNGNLSWGRSRFFKDRSAIGYRHRWGHATWPLSIAAAVSFTCSQFVPTVHASGWDTISGAQCYKFRVYNGRSYTYPIMFITHGKCYFICCRTGIF